MLKRCAMGRLQYSRSLLIILVFSFFIGFGFGPAYIQKQYAFIHHASEFLLKIGFRNEDQEIGRCITATVHSITSLTRAVSFVFFSIHYLKSIFQLPYTLSF